VDGDDDLHKKQRYEDNEDINNVCSYTEKYKRGLINLPPTSSAHNKMLHLIPELDGFPETMYATQNVMQSELNMSKFSAHLPHLVQVNLQTTQTNHLLIPHTA
jgi:hypothetical protein